MKRAPSAPRAAALGLAFCLAGPVAAYGLDPEQPLRVQADRIEVNQKTAVSRYRGNVRIERGDTRIRADQVDVRQGAGSVETVSAQGGVRLEHGADVIESELVHYYPGTRTFQAGDGTGRVHMTLHPRPPETARPGTPPPAPAAAAGPPP